MRSDRFTVILTDSARDDLWRNRALGTRIARALRTLAERPERGHPLTGTLAHCRSLVLSRSHGGYRAVYIIQSAKQQCVVLAIGPHATVYDEAARRYVALAEKE
jgi:mRNA-degrading endonuclease RelE of RelBE toxin-antitoxin system